MVTLHVATSITPDFSPAFSPAFFLLSNAQGRACVGQLGIEFNTPTQAKVHS
jgi:hypothetical protein